jgi:hypothetical protein
MQAVDKLLGAVAERESSVEELIAWANNVIARSRALHEEWERVYQTHAVLKKNFELKYPPLLRENAGDHAESLKTRPRTNAKRCPDALRLWL